MADTLATLARLRHLQNVTAKRDLARAYQAELAADAALQDARQAPQTEAIQVQADQDALLAIAFAGWLPQSAAIISRRSAEAARAAQAREAAIVRLRACTGALDAVVALQREHEVLARKARDKRLQLLLDETRGKPGLPFDDGV